MKHSALQRFLSLILCVLLLGASFVWITPAHAADVSIQNGTGSREPIRVGKTYSYRAILNGSFTGFGFKMPTWTKTNCYATLSLYRWKGTYAATIAEQPVASVRQDPLKDGQCHWLTFDEQPAGEYLFHISDVSADVGVWTNSSPTDSKGFLYIDGLEQRGEPELFIRFTDSPADPFGVCESSGDIRKSLYPYTATGNMGVMNMNSAMGIRANLNAAFAGVQFKMATYMSTEMEIDMSVYAWKGTYEKTIEAEPVARDRVHLIDNAMQGISFDKLPAGDYLFLAENFNIAPAMYVYDGVTDFLGYVYKDGFPSATNTQFPVMQIIFCEEKDVYFKECSAADDSITGDHTAPDEYVIPEDSLIYTHPVMPDTWVFTDGLGRVSLTNAEVGDPREDKTLAMFYWTWHIDGFAAANPTNLQKLSEQYPDAMQDYDNPLWATTTGSYFWNQPIWGYYRGDDKWVLRRQAELLTNAGVDVIFTDNTNAEMTWRNAYIPMMEEWTDAMEDGLLTPKISFMLPFWDKQYTNVQLQSIYLDVFRADKYRNLWFYWDGKPMVMAMRDAFSPTNSAIEKEIRKFFTFRPGQPGYVVENTAPSTWGWLSMYPQALYYKANSDKKNNKVEQMTVGVAMNHNYMTGSLDAMNGDYTAGRSYTSTFPDRYKKEGAEASKWGYNFAEQWNYALQVDPQVVFVTGWNEFRVGRYESWGSTENAFPDQFNDEFSRDIEPTKGDLKDHYYYQLVNFVRQYKGARAIPTPGTLKTIDMNGGYEQWKSVEPYYGAYIGNTEDRDADGYGDLHYTETSGRNDIIGAQVARDNDYLYFLVECAEDITPCTDSLWMNLYLDTDQTNQGWETFEYIVRGSESGKMALEKFSGTGYESSRVADVEYTLDGRYLTVKIAKSDLGLSGHDYTVNFAWTDNVHDEGDYTTFSGDIMDFYTSGDVAPGARFKYSYISTSENAGVSETETETDTETETETLPETTPDTEPETQPETDPVTEPDTEPATQPETASDTATQPDADTQSEVDTDTEAHSATDIEPTDTTAVPTETETETEATQDSGSGCQSATLLPCLPILVALCVLPLLQRRKRNATSNR